MNLDMQKLEPLLGKVVNEMGAASNGALVILGDKLGLFRALSQGAMTSAELAAATGTHERYVREWLSAQAASGFVDYQADTARFSMSPEQAAVFADEDSPVFVAGGFSFLSAVYNDEPKLAEAFRSGKGLPGASLQLPVLRVERFFRPGYRAHLVASGCRPRRRGRLGRGAKVADVGCRHGASTLLMAQAFPTRSSSGSTFTTDRSRMPASRRTGPATSVSRSRARIFPAAISISSPFDTLHGMGDPSARSRTSAPAQERRHADAGRANGRRQPSAISTVGRVYYAGSTHTHVEPLN
jgi:hypothetical protein